MASNLINIKKSIKEKVKDRLGVPNMFRSLENLKKLGFNPHVIVDVGAYEGEWTKRVSEIFPVSKCLMVEAMESKEKVLKKIKSKNSNIDYVISVLGAIENEEISFSEVESASSVLEEKIAIQNRTKKKLTTLKSVLNNKKISKIDLLKLDVQGYELEVLKGLGEKLNETDVILSEVSLLDLHKGVPLLKDVINLLYEFQFVVYDICSVETRRPLDNALWQTDLIFVKEESIYRTDKRYNA